jgi:hypothetical protein
MPVEDGGGDIGGKVGEAENLAVVGSMQVLALGQIGEFGGSAVQQLFIEPVGVDESRRKSERGRGISLSGVDAPAELGGCASPGIARTRRSSRARAYP